MSIEPAIMLFAGIVFIAYAVQNAVGFGALLVCITLGSHLLDIRQIMTLAIPLSMLQSGFIVWRDRASIDARLLLRRIMPLMSVGLVLGFVVARDLRDTHLRVVFAGLVIVLAIYELWRLRPPSDEDTPPRPPPRLASVAAIFGAGIAHGIYAAGGPLLVYAVGREGLDKHRFRATLSAVWVGLNTLLISGFVMEGRYTTDTGRDIVVLLAVLPFGLWIGDLIHQRVPERPFKITVFILLIAGAASLIVR
ncbi:MAG: sulfite exporter TauE/SafE family protein [Deltaproteobacteria bacterium]|nr:sulfite exporter TauE/SafE family protein [Deltaproteobacteria bacterium]